MSCGLVQNSMLDKAHCRCRLADSSLQDSPEVTVGCKITPESLSFHGGHAFRDTLLSLKTLGNLQSHCDLHLLQKVESPPWLTVSTAIKIWCELPMSI